MSTEQTLFYSSSLLRGDSTMLQNVHTGVTKRLLVLAIMFTFSAMSLVIIKAANGDNNIVYKR